MQPGSAHTARASAAGAKVGGGDAGQRLATRFRCPEQVPDPEAERSWETRGALARLQQVTGRLVRRRKGLWV